MSTVMWGVTSGSVPSAWLGFAPMEGVLCCLMEEGCPQTRLREASGPPKTSVLGVRLQPQQMALAQLPGIPSPQCKSPNP